MDSRVTLALMAKARAVFEQPDTVFSFPVPPFALSFAEMRAVAGESVEGTEAGAPFEFARLVNQYPSFPIWTSASDAMLWSLYDDILHRSARLATVERSSADEAAFRAAESVLYSVDEQGIRTPSPRATIYAQYRDRWFSLQQAYRARRDKAESPEAEESIKTAWAQDEPALRAEIAAIEADWRGLGFRTEIETAQSALSTLAARDPLMQWDRWSRNFNFFLDSRTDLASEATFFPTTYSPSDVVDTSDWLDFQLSSAEFEQLVRGAPEELRARLDPSGQGPNVSKVSFGCRTVGVTRPWLDTAIFRAQFWRFQNASRFLSDGGSPPRGEWPAYVAGLILARNIEVTTPPAPPPPAGDPQPPRGGRHSVPPRIVRDHRRGGASAGAVTTTRRVELSESTRVAVATEPLVVRRVLRPGSERSRVVPQSARAMATLRASQVHRLNRPVAKVAGFTPPAPSSAPADDEVLILAFICRPLPKCPNPDPALFRD